MQSSRMGPQSAPTSPVSKTSGVQHKTSSAANFFTFRCLFRGSKNSSKRKLKQIYNKTKEKFATIGTNTTKILLRQSYSFYDIQQFFNSQQNDGQNTKYLYNDRKNSNFCKFSDNYVYSHLTFDKPQELNEKKFMKNSINRQLDTALDTALDTPLDRPTIKTKKFLVQ